jgi:hypothetical protein
MKMAMIDEADITGGCQFSASTQYVWRDVQGFYSPLNDSRLATIHSGLYLRDGSTAFCVTSHFSLNLLVQFS